MSFRFLFEVCCAMIRQIQVGDVPVGGGAPVSIQSMLNTKTTDVEGSLRQLEALKAAGCQIARLAVPNEEAAGASGRLPPSHPCPWWRTFILTTSWPLPQRKAARRRSASTPATLAGKTGCRRWWRCARASTFPSGSGVNGRQPGQKAPGEIRPSHGGSPGGERLFSPGASGEARLL